MRRASRASLSSALVVLDICPNPENFLHTSSNNCLDFLPNPTGFTSSKLIETEGCCCCCCCCSSFMGSVSFSLAGTAFSSCTSFLLLFVLFFLFLFLLSLPVWEAVALGTSRKLFWL